MRIRVTIHFNTIVPIQAHETTEDGTEWETHGRLDAELLREIHRGGEAEEILLGLGRGHRRGGGAPLLCGGEGCGGSDEGSEDSDLHHLGFLDRICLSESSEGVRDRKMRQKWISVTNTTRIRGIFCLPRLKLTCYVLRSYIARTSKTFTCRLRNVSTYLTPLTF
jgi:hypothetical protein